MSCEGARTADPSAGRVSLHPCFPNGLWTASTEITGEGGTPALSLSPRMRKGESDETVHKVVIRDDRHPVGVG